MDSYYVVKRGNKPGIYKTWAECKNAVDGYSNPIFKKFNSFEDANAFYRGQLQPFQMPSQYKEKTDKHDKPNKT